MLFTIHLIDMTEFAVIKINDSVGLGEKAFVMRCNNAGYSG